MRERILRYVGLDCLFVCLYGSVVCKCMCTFESSLFKFLSLAAYVEIDLLREIYTSYL